MNFINHLKSLFTFLVKRSKKEHTQSIEKALQLSSISIPTMTE